MLQANPTLTPNLVKAILQYTAEANADVDVLTQGAGFLNARGAVTLAQVLQGGQARQPLSAVTRRGASTSSGATTASPAA